MRSRILTLSAALLLTTPGVAPADSSYTNYGLGRDNVIVSGSMIGTNGDVEGATVVGGNLSSGGVNYAIRLAQPSSSTDALVVGGNITAGNTVTVDAGVTRYGGTVSGTVHDNSNVAPIHDATVSSLSTNLNTYLTGVSGAFQSMASTNTTANPAYTIAGGSGLTDQNGTLTFNIVPGSNGVAVLDISSSLFNSSTYKGHGFEYNVVSDGYSLKEIVFNVSGTAVDMNLNSGFGNSFKNSGLNASTLFNFYQATSIVSESNFGYFYGALLAPDATYTNHADNEGSVYVANFDQMSEVHLPGSDTTSATMAFAGAVPSSGFSPSVAAAVPEPATVVSTLSGLAMAAGAAWRRRRRSRA